MSDLGSRNQYMKNRNPVVEGVTQDYLSNLSLPDMLEAEVIKCDSSYFASIVYLSHRVVIDGVVWYKVNPEYSATIPDGCEAWFKSDELEIYAD